METKYLIEHLIVDRNNPYIRSVGLVKDKYGKVHEFDNIEDAKETLENNLANEGPELNDKNTYYKILEVFQY